MCLILFAWNPNSDEPLIVAANRDEFYSRASQKAHVWADHSGIIAGKDLEQKGTWLGVTQTGRFAAVTNYRNLDPSQYPRSRGELTRQFLSGASPPEEYANHIMLNQHLYAGFNLLVGDRSALYYYSNRSNQPPQRLEAGIYGLSNHLINTPWPKVTTGVSRFKDIIESDAYTQAERTQALLTLLQDDQPVEESLLPETGVGIAIEKLLSPLFIKSPGYGTRASTIVQINKNGLLSFIEQCYEVGGVEGEQSTYHITLEG